jgi:nicotinic acid phosphoribosyltransferase
MEQNFAKATDSYKLGHHDQYPEDTEVVYSYFEARNGAKYPTTTMAGLQFILKEFFEGVVITKEKVDKAERFSARHFGNDSIFNRQRWDYIVENLGGRLPLRIKAVGEGTVVPINNVMMTVENTDEKCSWLTNHAETLLTHVWYPSNVATISRHVKTILSKYLEETCDTGKEFAGLPFMLHDFGFRGATSNESAAVGGMAHLINFLGSDTIIAMDLIEQYYGDVETGFSIPATEHSVMTAQGEDGEVDVIQQLLNNYPTGLLSIVSDSYNIYRCVDQYYGVKFYDQIMARDGKVVVRPDSGNPVAVMCGNTDIKDYTSYMKDLEVNTEAYNKMLRSLLNEDADIYLEDTPHGECGEGDVDIVFRIGDEVFNGRIGVDWNRYDKQFYYVDGYDKPIITPHEITLEEEGLLNILWRRFGGTINEKGFKVLNPKVGIIWGDGIDATGIEAITRNAKNIGFSTENLVFGMGGGLLQKHNRDTQRFAFKCSAQKRGGVWTDIFKNPIDQSKASKKGKLALVIENGEYKTIQSAGDNVEGDLLKTVFENGELVNELDFNQVIANSNI